MTVYVSNKQVSSRQAYIYTLIYIGDQGIVYLFVGHVNQQNDVYIWVEVSYCISKDSIVLLNIYMQNALVV